MYFFKTTLDKGRNRLRPLSGQKIGANDVDVTLNVQSDKTIRSMYPIGTTFGSERLIEKSGFYEASQIYPIGLSDSDYKNTSHKPSDEMVREYEKFIGVGTDKYTDVTSSETIPFEDAPETKKSAKSLLSKLKSNKNFKCPDINKGFYINPDDWYLLIRNITNQINTMLIGPTGTGKTELIMLICKKLGIPCHVYDMGSMQDPIAGLLGVHRLKKGGESIFDYSQFSKDIQEPCVILLDELSRAPVTANNILFPCLDSRRRLSIEIAGGDDMRSVKVNPECTFVATANIGAEYTGTMSLDRALVGRFFPLELDYMPQDKEEFILQKRCGVDNLSSKNIVKIANDIRSLYRKQEISASISTREVLMVADLVADGWKLDSACQLVLLPLFEGTKSDGERGVINKIIMSY